MENKTSSSSIDKRKKVKRAAQEIFPYSLCMIASQLREARIGLCLGNVCVLLPKGMSWKQFSHLAHRRALIHFRKSPEIGNIERYLKLAKCLKFWYYSLFWVVHNRKDLKKKYCRLSTKKRRSLKFSNRI